jgi:hypothetical protein
MIKLACTLTALGLALTSYSAAAAKPSSSPHSAPLRHNVVILVADGLRAGSVNPTDAPTLWALLHHGVSFTNSHSLFPTFTTANASAIATGHYLGDTGDFANGIYPGFRMFNTGNFGKAAGNGTPFIESDTVLGDLDDHFDGNFLGEDTLLALARANGYSTAAVGKLGPVAIQDVGQLAPQNGRFAIPQTLIIDDLTGTADGIGLDPDLAAALNSAGLPLATPVRHQSGGDSTTPGTTSANVAQQRYFVDATTRAILPLFRTRGRPFVLVYWSRDPDGSQHNQGDSLGKLAPGINGPTSRAGVQNADDNFRQILDYVRRDPALRATTDIFVTSDHGFATISKREIDAQHHTTQSHAATRRYADVPPGFLPPGFLSIDLAHHLGLPLFDPDTTWPDEQGVPQYARVGEDQHPTAGNGYVGGSGTRVDPPDAEVIVNANGGSDLIYVPGGNAERVRDIVAFLARQDYVGALFVDDSYGPAPGALPSSRIALVGNTKLPHPAIVVGFRTFALDPKQPLQSAVQIADTQLQQGQGMHGSLGRDNTFNFMAAIGPDFRTGLSDSLPVGNADIAPTLASILHLTRTDHGALTGRVLGEALLRGSYAGVVQRCIVASAPADNGSGLRTVLEYQELEGRVYLDRAELTHRGATKAKDCRPAIRKSKLP